ncbi:MAG: glycoside hydrolase family 5 protein, partial [Bacteroidetes bacterium]|nr:glycoside hydrolase family 5 protein [Bacteroidota bacterium]
MLFRSLIAILFTLSSCVAPTANQQEKSAEFPKAEQVIKEMASGVNLGNVFENGYQNIEFFELAAFITTYQRAGMNHIRIPTTWVDGVQGSSLADEQGHVNFDHPRFAILKQVIDFAIERDLYVVLNAHHERTFKANYDGSELYNNQFSTLWTDIANHFKDYDHRLIFEVLNEPEGAFGHWGTEVSPVSDQALLFTRGVMQLGVQAIRATGGNNLHRTVMIATNAYGNHNQIFSV